MTVPIAAQGHVGLRRDESFASGGAISTYQPIVSEDMQIVKTYHYPDQIMSNPQQIGSRLMNVAIAGSVTFFVSPQGPEEWWAAGIGATSSPYSPSRPLSSLVLEFDRDTASILTSGDMISSLELSSSQGGPLQCVASIEGKGYQQKTASSPSFVSGDDPYLHSEATFQFNDVENLDITEFSLSINNNLITDLYANQKERRDIPATKTVVTGSFTKLFQDTDELTTFLAELPVKIQVTYSRGSNSFDLALNKVHIDNHSTPLSSQTDYVSETFEFTAFVENVDNKVLTVTVT